MSTQYGPAQAGLTGLFDFPRLGASGVNFTLEIILWKVQQEGEVRKRMGRGSTGFIAAMRYVSTSGGGVATGLERGDGWPAPTDWEGAEGTIRIDFNKTKGQYALFPIKVTSFGHLYDANRDKDGPKETLGFVFNGLPTFHGWPGSQPTAAAITKADQIQWANSYKTIDPSGLQSTAQRFIDIYGTLTNSDSAEQTKLAAVISAAVPPITTPHDAKLRSSTFARDAIDGGTITEIWGLTDTTDDVEQPATLYGVDKTTIFGQVQIRKVQTDDVIDWPDTPDEPSDLKQGRVEKVQLNDSRWALTYFFVRNNSEDAIEVDGAHTSADPNDLDETAVVIVVTATEAPPTAPSAPVGILIDTDTQPLTRPNGSYSGFWRHVFRYGPTTRLQAIQFRAEYIVDPSTINDRDSKFEVNGSSTPPSTPTPSNADLKLVRRHTQRIQGAVEKWLHTFYFARNTAEDELEHKGRTVDPDDFGETERIPIVHTSESSSPGTPSQLGTTSNLVGTDVQRLCVANASFSGLWLWTFHFAPTTRKQEIEQEGHITNDVGTALDDDQIKTLTSSSSAWPADPGAANGDLVLFRIVSRKIQNTPEKWKHTFYYGYRTGAEKLEAERTETNADVSVLQSTAVTAAVWLVGSGAPSAPTLSGYVLRFNHDVETNNPVYRLRIYRWGLLTTEQEHTFLKSRSEVEAGQLDRHPIVVKITSSSTEAFTSDNPDSTNLSLYKVVSVRQTDGGKWEHSGHYRPLTAEQEMTAQLEVDAIDPASLEDEATRVLYNTTSTPDAAPSVSGKTHWKTIVERVAKVKYRYIYKYRWRTSAELAESLKTKTSTDLSALESTATTADMWLVSGGAPSDPTLSGYALRFKADVEVDNPLYRLRIYEWGLRTTEQDITYLQSKRTAESGAIKQQDVVWEITTSALPSAPAVHDSTNLTYHSTVTHRLTATKYAHMHFYAVLTAAEEMTAQYEGDVVDPLALEDEATRVLYNSTTTPDAAPSVSGKVHYRTTIKRVGKAKYRYVYEYRFRNRADELEAQRTKTHVDASDINSDATTAEVWTVGSPPSAPSAPSAGFVLADYEDVEIGNPLYRLRVYQWGLVTNADKIIQNESVAEVDVESGIQHIDATVDNSIIDPQLYADSVLASNQADPTFIGATVKKLSPNKSLVKRQFTTEDKKIHGMSNHVVRERVRGVPETAIVSGQYSPGNITVYDAQATVYINFNGGDLRARPQYIDRAKGRFLLRRVYASDDFADHMHRALCGLINDDVFLGFLAGEVMFQGAQTIFTQIITGERRLVVDYEFQWDAWKHFNDSFLPEGTTAVNSGSVLSSGLYNATQLEAGFVCAFPAETSFAGFLT